MAQRSTVLPAREVALRGRSTPLAVPEVHYVSGHRIVAPFPAGTAEAVFASKPSRHARRAQGR